MTNKGKKYYWIGTMGAPPTKESRDGCLLERIKEHLLNLAALRKPSQLRKL